MEDQIEISKARAYCERNGINRRHLIGFDWISIAKAIKTAMDFVPPKPCETCGQRPCACVERGYR